MPAADIAVFEYLLDPFADAVSIFEAANGALWRIAGYSSEEPRRGLIEAALALAARAGGLDPPELRIEPLPEKDWLAENRRGFAPVSAGGFFVHGSHVEDPPPAGSVAIVLDAGPAFGAGTHETTRGCLRALDKLARRRGFKPNRFLDIGSGSGILAIAMAKLWGRPVRAIDDDPIAVETTAANARANKVGELIEAALGDGHDADALASHEPYDLITANIVLRPLMEIAPLVGKALAPGGYAVLSGILRGQIQEVRGAYRQAGFVAAGSVPLGDWRTLIYRRQPN